MRTSLLCLLGIFSAVAKRAPHIGTNIVPRTPAQSRFANALSKPDIDIAVGVGPAGCGKTLFACMAAMRALQSGDVEKVIFTRPLVSVDNESLGFFPGTMDKKMEVWTIPFFDAAKEILGATEVARLQRAGALSVVPLAYMRGRTFKDTFIIADEMQNSSPMQMFMLATRIGDRSRLALLGDARQSDRPGVNGLADFETRAIARNSKRIECVRFGADDVQRSAIAAEIVSMYDTEL